MDGKTKIKPKEKTVEKYKEPDEYLVILLNDDYTNMNFVVAVLMEVFNKNMEEASRIMLDVHKRGKGVVGQYPWDIAVTGADQVCALARENDFPLKCIVEPAH